MTFDCTTGLEMSRRSAIASLTALSAAAAAVGGAMITPWARAQDGRSSPVPPSVPEDTPESMGWDENARQYVLPPLPYEPDALEPHIDAETMSLHHDKHHAAYVKGLNSAISLLADLRQSSTPDGNAMRAALRDLAFHGSGHFLHCLFWKGMASPKSGGGERPSGALADRINHDFGSFDHFTRHFQSAANAVQGSGWAILVHEPVSQRLLVMQAERHENVTAWGVQPLLPLDVWEHAYYLKHRNDRKAYVAAFANVINWPYVAQRFESVHSA